MQDLDFNTADSQRSDLIPDKSLVKVVITIRPGGAGPEGWLKASQSSDAEMIDAEFTVMAGPFANRKLWQNMVWSGGKVDDKGRSKAGEITRSTIRAIIESARGISPSDTSERACEGRRLRSFEDLDGMVFACKIGIEKDKSGAYPDKNKIAVVLTPDKKEYQDVMNEVATVNAPPLASGATSKPAWVGNGGDIAKTEASPSSTAPGWVGEKATETPTPKPSTGNVPAWAK